MMRSHWMRSFSIASFLLLATTPAVATDLLVNGDFDTGPGPPWVEFDGGTGYPLIVSQATSPVPAQSGDYLVWLGGISDGTLCLSQDIQIPVGANQLELMGFRWIETEETGSGAWDSLIITIQSPQGVLLEQLAEWSNLDTTTGWTAFSMVVSEDYAGETIRLLLCSQNDTSGNTSFFIDSLVLDTSAPSGVRDSDDDKLPATGCLLGNYPNPFNPRTTIVFELAEAAAVDLRIYDLSGRMVRNLLGRAVLGPGLHEAIWDGLGDGGQRVASGTYFYRLEVGSFSETKRMVLIK